jgi:hypothetical protein
MEIFNLMKWIDVEAEEQSCVEISNRFAALEEFGTEVDINSAWEVIREIIVLSVTI